MILNVDFSSSSTSNLFFRLFHICINFGWPLRTSSKKHVRFLYGIRYVMCFVLYCVVLCWRKVKVKDHFLHVLNEFPLNFEWIGMENVSERAIKLYL